MEMIKDCGIWAWLDILLTFVALIAAVVAIVVAGVSKSKGAAIGVALAALVLAVCVGGVGLVGTFMGNRMTEAALSGEGIDPDQKERIRAEGQKEAAGCTTIGLTLMVLPFLLSAGATVLAMVKKPQA